MSSERAKRLVAVPALVALLLTLLSVLSPTSQLAVASPHAVSHQVAKTAGKATAKPDCPARLRCKFEPTAFVNATTRGDGTCNYTPAYKNPNRVLKRYGITEHTTEGTLASALKESQDAVNCVSWNYLVAPDGTIYQSVPLNAAAYDSANRTFNNNDIQVENIGHSGLCDVTPQEFKASALLAKYLAHRFHFKVSPNTVIGHDAVPAITDARVASMHWDPGICWDWNKFWTIAGWHHPKLLPLTKHSKLALIYPTFNQNHQPVSACTDGTSQCDPSRVPGTNFLTLYSAPCLQAPLLSDPYLHAAGKTGTTAMNDWGDKAQTGRTYSIASLTKDWLGIWFSGKVAYIYQPQGKVFGVHGWIVVPKHKHVKLYGRPLPSKKAFRASTIPTKVWKAQDLLALYSQYSFNRGQAYALISSKIPNKFYEGCDKTNCSAKGDGAVVIGKTKYLEVGLNHRLPFVRAKDVIVEHV